MRCHEVSSDRVRATVRWTQGDKGEARVFPKSEAEDICMQTDIDLEIAHQINMCGITPMSKKHQCNEAVEQSGCIRESKRS